MTTPDTIVVTITPRDVLTTQKFCSTTDCAMAKAVRRKTKTDNISIGVNTHIIKGIKYHCADGFEHWEFQALKKKAESGERFKVKKTLTRVLSSLNSEIK